MSDSKTCSTCEKFSSRFATDFEGTCVLDGVFVSSRHGCSRWADAKSNGMSFMVTTGADHVVLEASQGTRADI